VILSLLCEHSLNCAKPKDISCFSFVICSDYFTLRSSYSAELGRLGELFSFEGFQPAKSAAILMVAVSGYMIAFGDRR
jgi:hypothetical protein